MNYLPLVVAVLVGSAFGSLRRGRLANLRRIHVHVPLLAVVAIGSGVTLDHWAVPLPRLVALAGIAAGLALSWRNIHLAGMMIVGIGITVNLLPVVLNGAVPVRGEALIEAQIVRPSELPTTMLSGSREFVDGSTLLADLGDTIPLRITNQVLSYGDLILLVGLADVIANGMRRQHGCRRRGRSGHERIRRARPVHDWGTAPRPRPESPFQYSARPETSAPRTVDLASSSAQTDSVPEPDRARALQSR